MLKQWACHTRKCALLTTILYCIVLLFLQHALSLSVSMFENKQARLSQRQYCCICINCYQFWTAHSKMTTPDWNVKTMSTPHSEVRSVNYNTLLYSVIISTARPVSLCIYVWKQTSPPLPTPVLLYMYKLLPILNSTFKNDHSRLEC
jgi:hypothetical protein